MGVYGHAKRLVKIVFAFTLLLIALILGFVPGIPGWPLAIVGLTILAAEYVWARRLLHRVHRGAHHVKAAARWRPNRLRKDRPKGPPP
jgi:hypothetical protein